MTQWQAIVFDLDDTLYPEAQYVTSGLRAVAAWAQRAFDLPAGRTFAELSWLQKREGSGSTFDEWLRRYRLEEPEHVAAMVQVYREHTPDIALYPEADDLLDQLAGRCRLGLVTDGWLDVQRRKVAALGLEKRLDAIVYSDLWGRDYWKPHRRPFEAVLQRLGVPACQAVYVADNPAKDFRGARTAGMESIRVRMPGALHRTVEPIDPADCPDYELSDLRYLDRRAAA